MKPKTAQLFASLIVDEWPLPTWFCRRIQTHPDIAEALGSDSKLETRLRESSGGKMPSLDSDLFQPAEDNQVNHRVIARLILATAALALMCVGLWHWANRERPNLRNIGPVANTIDTDPIVASFSAGQTVARRVSSGVQNVATQLAQASNRFGSQFTIGNRDAVSSLLEIEEGIDAE